ncbi:glycerophosphodiester phosphodiesterase family protein [Litoribacter ruber]|uniref:glycerophosphodiester phosphodiesterase family protein n=1 Tax=Litoribacter ruber TaxID=702568 RepID=UPI001BDAA941|nr:glycerophosphodiester phosphodiesterase family protein [Litoribacter ruber]MBT0811829.1 glycerophosphodiester phosphodiesterase family protein [Litoribacter ruber]
MKKVTLYILMLAAFACQSQQGESTTGENYINLSSAREAKEFFTWDPSRSPMVSAHRGGPYPGFPENAIETFDHTLRNTPAIIEFDVELTKDSVMILMHDNTLDRTTTGKGKVVNYTFDEIRRLKLVDNEGSETEYQVPTLREALEWSKGKAILTVDVKRNVPFEMVVSEIEATSTVGNAAVITYNFKDAKKIHDLNPDLMLSVTIRNEEEIKRFEDTGVPWENVIAFTGLSERTREFNQRLHDRGVFTILGVLGNLDKMAEAGGDELYVKFVQNGADILATDRPIEAAEALRNE